MSFHDWITEKRRSRCLRCGFRPRFPITEGAGALCPASPESITATTFAEGTSRQAAEVLGEELAHRDPMTIAKVMVLSGMGYHYEKPAPRGSAQRTFMVCEFMMAAINEAREVPLLVHRTKSVIEEHITFRRYVRPRPIVAMPKQ